MRHEKEEGWVHQGIQLAIILCFLSAAFTKNILIDGIFFGDVILFLGGLITIFVRLRCTIMEKWPPSGSPLLLFWIFLTIQAIVYSIYPPSMLFDIFIFLKSFIKFTFYLGSFFLLFPLFAEFPRAKIYRVLLNVLVFHAAVAILIYAMMWIGVALPFSWIWFGQSPESYYNVYFRWGNFPVIRGLFSEPSMYGMFQAMGLACLFTLSNNVKNNEKLKIVIVMISILLTLSISSIFLLMVVLLLNWRKIRFNINQLLWGGAGLCLVFFGPSWAHISDLVQSGVADRIILISVGGDNSTNARIIGTFEVMKASWGISPFIGIGFGQFDIFFSNFSSSFWDFGEVHAWNIFAYIFATCGLIGLILFGGFLWPMLVRNPKGWVAFIIYMFSLGAFLEPGFWLFSILLLQDNRTKVLFKRGRSNE